MRSLDPKGGPLTRRMLALIVDTIGGAGQSIDGLEVVVTDRGTEVRGRALDARGRGVTDATVMVFSTDRALWGAASRWGETSRFLAAVKTGKDGAFNVRNLPPGDYYAAAATGVRPGEWRDPDLLDALIPNAAHLIIFEGDAVTATLSTVTR